MSDLLSRVRIIAGCLWMLTSCGNEHGPGTPSSDAGSDVAEGNLTVRLESNRPVPGFTVNVQDVYGGHVLTSQFVELESEHPSGDEFRYAEALFVLPTGRYVVVALPATGPDAPFGTCGVAVERAIVEAAQTTELALSASCPTPQDGGSQTSVE